jgi:hypothetical protein
MTFQPAIADRSITGAITAASQTIVLPLGNEGQSSWFLQVTGNFVGSIIVEVSGDGINYLPVDFRQTSVGRIGHTVTVAGIYRGSCASATHIRVRATAWTSGNSTITLRSSVGIGATFSNTLQEIRDLEQYFSTVAGGNVGFSATVGIVSIVGTGGLVGVFLNPSNSTVDLYVSSITVGCNRAGSFQRIRNATITNPGTTLSIVNKGGGSTAATGRLHPTATVSGGTQSRTIYLSASDSDETVENGSTILRPGQSLHWHFIPDANQAANATVNVCWWELPSII